MKLLKITTLYPDYLTRFYADNPGLVLMPYMEQKRALDHDASGWADFWSHALAPLGHEVLELTINAEPLQRAWAAENGVPGGVWAVPELIVIEQVRRFKPEVLWYDHIDGELLRRLRDTVATIRLVLGWVGSAIPKSDVWRQMDLVLSCAPESVTTLREAGFSAAHMHHGFDPRINSRLVCNPKRFDCSFIGQVVRSGCVHNLREELLEAIASRSTIEIFSPSAEFTWRDDMKAMLKMGVYRASRTLRRVGLPEPVVDALPVLGKAARWPAEPARPVSRKLKHYLRPAVFGLAMFQVLRDSKVALNIHADSSPRFASNMRLFETTGVGTCLVTDWKENIHEIFVPEKEVVTYSSAEECVEKIRWLLDHPREREEIAAAGMSRTFQEHTLAHRAAELNEIIRDQVTRGRC